MNSIVETIKPQRANTHIARRKSTSAFIHRALREPVLHFLILGALLFGVSEYLEQRARFTHIEITQAQIDGIKDSYRLQYGAEPTQPQVDSLVDSLIREEVFYHEALRLNLDKDDEIVRRRLVQKYEFLQQDLAVATPPTEQQLRDYFNAHRTAYASPEKANFSQVFFSVDKDGDNAAHQRALQTLLQLQSSDVERAPNRGDAFAGLTDYAAQTQAQVTRVFGSGEMTRQVFQADINRWQGPYRSGYGWHLIRVTARQPAAPASFDSVRDLVQRDYEEQLRSVRNDVALKELLKHFKVERAQS